MTTLERLYTLQHRASKALEKKDNSEMREVHNLLDELKPSHLTQAENDMCDQIMVRLSDALEVA